MKKVTKTMTLTFVFNFIMAIIEIMLGMISKSAAVIVDGFNTLSDSITDIISIIGSRWSYKRANKNYPFGYGQIEYLTNVIVGFVILALGFYLISSASQEEIIVPSLFLVLVPAFKIVFKFMLYRYITIKGKEYHNSILLSSSKETLLDISGSFLVLIAILLMQLGVLYADRVAAILVSLLVIKTGIDFIVENLGDLVGKQETDEAFIKEIKDRILEEKRILSIEKLIVLKSGPYYKLDAHVFMKGDLTLRVVHNTLEKTERNLKKLKKIRYINIVADPKIN